MTDVPEIRVYDENNDLKLRLGGEIKSYKDLWKFDWKSFWLGFLLCYAAAGFAAGSNVAKIPATNTPGIIYAGVMWAPLNLLPESIALKMVPEWAFDFEDE